MGKKKNNPETLKLSTGSRRFSQNMSLVGGLTMVVLPIKNRSLPPVRTTFRPAGPWQTPPVAEIVIWMVRGRQRLGVTAPQCLGN